MNAKRAPISDEAIGALIREMRTKRGMTQPELGEVIGVGAMQVSKYEAGASSISALYLVKIAEALKCKTTDLLP